MQLRRSFFSFVIAVIRGAWEIMTIVNWSVEYCQFEGFLSTNQNQLESLNQ